MRSIQTGSERKIKGTFLFHWKTRILRCAFLWQLLPKREMIRPIDVLRYGVDIWLNSLHRPTKKYADTNREKQLLDLGNESIKLCFFNNNRNLPGLHGSWIQLQLTRVQCYLDAFGERCTSLEKLRHKLVPRQISRPKYAQIKYSNEHWLKVLEA